MKTDEITKRTPRKDGDSKSRLAVTPHLIATTIISLLCVIIYSNTLNAPFAFDDATNIENNAYIRLRHIDIQQLIDAWIKSPSKNRPLANISFALNYYFGGYDVTGYHVVNVIIHLVNGLLVYFLSIIIFTHTAEIRSRKAPSSVHLPIPLISLFVALSFIAHPIQTQSVTYIVQRMNAMASLFCLLSLYLYIRGRVRQSPWKKWSFFAGCFVAWLMALGSKENAAVFPVVIMLYEWFFFQNMRFEWLKRNFKYLFGLTALLVLAAFLYLGSNPLDTVLASYANRDFTMSQRVLTQFRVILRYIGLLFYPHPSRLNLLHHVTTSQSFLTPLTTLLSMLFIVVILAFAVCFAKKYRLISFCILWFFINLFIESSVVGLEMIFEHRLYLPMFGFSVLVIYLTHQLFQKWRLWWIVVCVSMMLGLSASSYLRNRVWQDSTTLWADVISKNPQSYRAYHNLGVVLKEQGRHEEAIHYFSKALQIKPEFAEIHNNLGFALMQQGRLKEATGYFSEALQLNPDYAEALNNMGTVLASQRRINDAMGYFSKAVKIKPDYAEAHNNMGTALQEQGRFDEAIEHFSEALKIDPEFAGAHHNKGTALAGQGKLNRAMRHFLKAIKLQPDLPEAYNSMGTALARQKQFKEAVDYFSKAVQIKPDYVKAYYNMGTTLTAQDRFNAAADNFSKAVQIQPDFAEAHNGLGVVLARQGKCDQAIKHFSTALNINPGYIKARNNRNICLQRLKLTIIESKRSH